MRPENDPENDAGNDPGNPPGSTAAAIPVPALRDNYIWLIPAGGEPGRVLVVDPGEAAPVLAELQARQLEPAAILVTHHHADHTGGIRALLKHHAVPVYGPAASSIASVDHPLKGDEVIQPGGVPFRVMAVPGHTLDHIAYYGAGLLLCGDTLFAGGCGRLFEGTPPQMLASLRKLALLPEETKILCAHEYTVANLEFAAAVEPDNEAVQARLARARQLRAAGRPTLPSTLAEELRTNPFLRCTQAGVIAAAARFRRTTASQMQKEHEVFAAIRSWKDVF